MGHRSIHTEEPGVVPPDLVQPGLFDGPMMPPLPGPDFAFVPGHPGYAARRDGTVWTCRGRGAAGVRGWFDVRWRQLKSRVNNNGYLDVHIREGRRSANKAVHRLILAAFDGPCPAGMECRHLDGVRTNCRADNLSWGTHLENCEDRKRHGTQVVFRGEANAQAKLTGEAVLEIRRMHECKVPRGTIAEMFNIHPHTVGLIASRRRWKHI